MHYMVSYDRPMSLEAPTSPDRQAHSWPIPSTNFWQPPFLPSTTPLTSFETMTSTLSHRTMPTTTSSSSGSDADEPITYTTTAADAPAAPRATLQKKDWRPKATIHLRKMAERTFAEKICSLAFPPESLHGQLPFSLLPLRVSLCVPGTRLMHLQWINRGQGYRSRTNAADRVCEGRPVDRLARYLARRAPMVLLHLLPSYVSSSLPSKSVSTDEMMR